MSEPSWRRSRRAGDGLLEDRRVRGYAAQVVFFDHAPEFAAVEPSAARYRTRRMPVCINSVRRYIFSFDSVVRVAACEGREIFSGASITCSGEINTERGAGENVRRRMGGWRLSGKEKGRRLLGAFVACQWPEVEAGDSSENTIVHLDSRS